ncbi:MAG TPA: AI-2E family transporter [Planctomycetota bacterium]|nr:AI-2E family transporter [Planctomycetota bacterium]
MKKAEGESGPQAEGSPQKGGAPACPPGAGKAPPSTGTGGASNAAAASSAAPDGERRRNLPAFFVLIIALGGLLALAWRIFVPFVAPIVIALVMTIMSYPLYTWVLRLVGGGRRGVASGITCMALVILLFIPVAWLCWSVTIQAKEGLEMMRTGYGGLEDKQWFKDKLKEWPWLRSSWDSVKSIVERLGGAEEAEEPAPASETADPETAGPETAAPETTGPETTGPETADAAKADAAKADAARADRAAENNERTSISDSMVKDVVTWARPWVTAILANTFEVVLKFFLMLFILFFFFKDGHSILSTLRRVVPLERGQQERVLVAFEEVSRSVIRGSLGTAAIQGIVASIVFLMVGIPAVFWGVMVSITALIPPVGTSLATVPLIIALFLSGHWVKGIVVSVMAVFVGVLDNVVRPLLMQGSLRIHPIWLVLSILGAVGAYGPLGILYGPLILVLLGTFVRLFVVEEARGNDTSPAVAPCPTPVQPAAPPA